MMPPRKKTSDVEQAVNDVGQALKSLLAAYEAYGASVTQQQHAKIFAHLTRSLSVMQEQCGRVVTINTVTSFSLDGPEIDFISAGQSIPSQQLHVPTVSMQPPPRTMANSPPPYQPPAAVPVPVGRLSKHANEPGAGEKIFEVPAPPPSPAKDDDGVGFITE